MAKSSTRWAGRFASALGALMTLLLASPLTGQGLLGSPSDVAGALGINIHFLEPAPGEVGALAASGARWVRMDFNWAAIERVPGEYDFSAYDRFMSTLDSSHLHPIFVFDYANPLYDHGLSPASDEARQAFARWAAASASHFQGRGVLWEMYNEPDAFWKPKPNTQDYIKLALATGEAFAESAPGEKLVGPASAVIDPPFLEACFRAGLLNYWSAVSIHPYRAASSPETVADDLRQVRLMIRTYAPPGKTIPIIVSEWGYSSVWKGIDEHQQAEMLVREWLTDIANDVPLTIWYDWRDGADRSDPEQHFGVIGFRKDSAATAPSDRFPPKPAYQAAKALTAILGDFRFNKRLALSRPEDYLLLFTKGDQLRLAAWTTGEQHSVELPASPGTFDRTGFTGERLAPVTAGRHGSLEVTLTGEPQYLAPQQPNELLAIAVGWQRLPLDLTVRAPAVLPLHFRVKNPSAKPVRFSIDAEGAPSEAGPAVKANPGEDADLSLRVGAVMRSVDPLPVYVELRAAKLGDIAQTLPVIAENPLRATVLPATASALPVAIVNASGDPFEGSVRVVSPHGLRLTSHRVALKLDQGAKNATVSLPLEDRPEGEYETGLAIVNEDQDVVNAVPGSRFYRVDDFSRYPAGSAPPGYRLACDGGAQPEGNALAVERADSPPVPGMSALRLTFHLPEASSSVCIAPDPELGKIPGEPQALGLWLRSAGNGDGKGPPVAPYLRFTDSTGQTFQEGGGPINWQGWRYVLIFMDTPRGHHSGGANDGVIHYPIRWDSLLMIENPIGQDAQGAVYLSGPTLLYGPGVGR